MRRTLLTHARECVGSLCALMVARYATEIDVDFVRKSVRAIGICAVKIERAADRCIDVLLELIQTKVSYVVQEAVVVIKVCAGGADAPGRCKGMTGHLWSEWMPMAFSLPPGHLPQVPEPVRAHHRHALREPRDSGRARGQGADPGGIAYDTLGRGTR